MTLSPDHLLYAGPDLDALTRQLKRLSGQAPSIGGRHLGFGTHNALVGLRSETYLELMAPDPDQDGGGFADDIEALTAAEMHAWCARTDDPDALEAAIEATGHGVTRHAMSRETTDGDTLAWELLFAQDHDWAGAAPFFISWGSTPHPAAGLHGDQKLRRLAILQRDPEPLRSWLRELGLTNGPADVVSVETGPARGLRAELIGRRGPFVLRGGAGGFRL